MHSKRPALAAAGEIQQGLKALSFSVLNGTAKSRAPSRISSRQAELGAILLHSRAEKHVLSFAFQVAGQSCSELAF